MKVTSFNISRPLKELGLDLGDYMFYYCKKGQLWNAEFEISPWENESLDDYYPAYTLEDILNALPSVINLRCRFLNDVKNKLEYKLEYKLVLTSYGLWYYTAGDDYDDKVYIFNKQDDESFVDLAARLLIKLIQTGGVDVVSEVNRRVIDSKMQQL